MHNLVQPNPDPYSNITRTPTAPIRAPSAWSYYIPWGEPSWEDEENETGRQAVLWESEGSFRSWYSQERLICHPCLKAICDRQKCVCGGARISRVWCTLILRGESEKGFEEASLLSATCLPMRPTLLFLFYIFSISCSLSLSFFDH